MKQETTRDKMRRNLHPRFLEGAVEEMFSEVLEVSEYPGDWKVDGVFNSERYLARQWPSIEPGKFCIMRKLKNRRDEKSLKAIIQRQMRNHLTTEKDSDEQLFKKNRIESIATYEDELCKDRHKYGRDTERSLYKDLEAYKAALFELVPDEVAPETKPKDRHPESSPFTTPKAFETFKYLCDHYPKQIKSRWTYLLNFIIECDIDPRITEAQYWDWITEHYNFDGDKKKQGGSSRKEYGKLRELHKVYLNEQA